MGVIGLGPGAGEGVIGWGLGLWGHRVGLGIGERVIGWGLGLCGHRVGPRVGGGHTVG